MEQEVLILSKFDIEPLVTMKEAIDFAEEAYKLQAKCQRKMIDCAFSSVTNLRIDRYNGELDFRAGYVEGIDYVCATLGCGYADTPAKFNLPAISGICTLNDARSGQNVALMEVEYLASLRTGAAGAVAAKNLARKDSRVIGIIGTGSQGRFQLMALREIYKIDLVKAFSRNKAKREAYAREMQEKLGINIEAVDNAQEAVKDSDIVVTCTRAIAPVVMNDWINVGVHINAIGADAPGKQELDPAILKRANKIVVDSKDQCVKIGEIQKAITQGLLREEDLHGEIGEVVMGWRPGRESEEEITVFDSTGLAVQDNVIFSKVYETAKRRKIGRYVRLN